MKKGDKIYITSGNIVVNNINPQVIERHDAFLSGNLGLDSKVHRHTSPTTLKAREQTEKLNIHTTSTKTIKESYVKMNNDIISIEHIKVN